MSCQSSPRSPISESVITNTVDFLPPVQLMSAVLSELLHSDISDTTQSHRRTRHDGVHDITRLSSGATGQWSMCPSYTAPSSSFQTIPFLRGRERQSAYTARLYWGKTTGSEISVQQPSIKCIKSGTFMMLTSACSVSVCQIEVHIECL